MKNYFGTDGIRFIYNEEVKSLISKIGKAISLLKYQSIIIGHDTRFSSEIILDLLVNQLSNKNVSYIGVCSTPALCYLSKKHHCLGIMITASHNPYQYNGIKLFKNGYKLDTKDQLKISSYIDKVTIDKSKDIKINLDQSLLNEYLLFLLSNSVSSRHKMIFDAGNGATSSYLHKIVLPINKDNIIINNHPDGYNINQKCGATDLNSLIQKMKEYNIDYGFSFDGDADRLIMIYKNQILDGDALIYILSKFTKKKKIVVTINSNLGLIKILSNKGFKIKTVNVGDSNILSYLKKHHLILGGENSGHIIQYDKLPSGDGLLNAVTIIKLLNKYDITTLLDGYTIYPHRLVSFTLNNNSSINHPLLKKVINDYLSIYKKDLIINIRLSGTENKLRIYVCHKDNNIVKSITSKLITLVKLIDNNISFDNYENITIDEKSTFGNNIIVNGQSTILNSHIGNNNVITSSYIADSFIHSNCSIGPFAHLRNNTNILDNVRIGNFVEIKNSTIGSNTKIAHLTYIGDCVCGSRVNFGCGVVICNYDGKNKHHTQIGNNVFIGSNSNLIAPLTIEDNVLIAAGSTITNSIQRNSFSIARSKQITKENIINKYPYFQEG